MPSFMADQTDPGEGGLEQEKDQERDESTRNTFDSLTQGGSADAVYLDIPIGIHLSEPGDALAVQEPVDQGPLAQ